MTGGEDRLASGTKSYLREIGAAESQTSKLLEHATPGQGVGLSLLEEIWSRSGEECEASTITATDCYTGQN